MQSLYCTIRRLFVLFVAYSRTIRTIRRLFVLFVAYSRTIRTIRRLFADYSYYLSTIRRLFVLFVDYLHYSLHYSSFINCRTTIQVQSINNIILNGLRLLLISRQSRRAFARNADVLLVFPGS